MTAPARKRKRRTNHESVRGVLVRFALTAGVLGFLLYLGLTLYSGVPLRDYKHIEAQVPQAGNLLSHDPVRIGGSRVGQVENVSTGPDGATRIGLQIEPDTNIPADSTLLLRANGLLGARYVQIVPGKSTQQIDEGGTLRAGAEALTYGATDAIDVFDEETRHALRPMLAELGTGLLGQGRSLNDATRDGAQAIVRLQTLLNRLERQTGAVDRLVPSLAAGMGPLDENREQIGQLFGTSSAALQPFVDRRGTVRDVLSEAPSALSAATTGLTSGQRLLAAAGSLAREARLTVPPAPAALRQTSALLRESPRPLKRAESLLQAAGPAVPGALKITRALNPALKPLDSVFTDLQPLEDAVEKYSCDIINFGPVFRSMTGFGTRNASGPNGPAMQFRLQAVGTIPTELLGAADLTGLVKREGYPPPCKYLSKPYPTFGKLFPGGGG